MAAAPTSRARCQLHGFFTRKLWFAHLAGVLIVFPGGFGTRSVRC